MTDSRYALLCGTKTFMELPKPFTDLAEESQDLGKYKGTMNPKTLWSEQRPIGNEHLWWGLLMHSVLETIIFSFKKNFFSGVLYLSHFALLPSPYKLSHAPSPSHINDLLFFNYCYTHTHLAACLHTFRG